jgi:hypothetical protein
VKFPEGHAHDSFNLDSGLPRGPTHLVRAARDPVQPPGADPQIAALLEKCLCRASLGADYYEVTSVMGVTRQIPYSASFQEWSRVCQELLIQAVLKE